MEHSRQLLAFVLLLGVFSLGGHVGGQTFNVYASGLGSVHGWVYGINYDGSPIPLPSAKITVKGPTVASTRSLMNGEYRMYLSPGNYTINVSAAGYAPYVAALAVSNGLTSEVNFYLELERNP
ncbi:MAG TPA: carboxypeptidase regulatory-like domain-containing protein [Candidatus Bathyarchaeia archaeon]|nr:carboxypeptidase regulatory-like domain-containing protein [Candidatus Bathyarchaeia archaeon]